MSVEAVERRLILLAMTGALTDAQLDGQACVWCGSETAPMEPVTFTNTQLFACIHHEI